MYLCDIIYTENTYGSLNIGFSVLRRLGVPGLFVPGTRRGTHRTPIFSFCELCHSYSMLPSFLERSPPSKKKKGFLVRMG